MKSLIVNVIIFFKVSQHTSVGCHRVLMSEQIHVGNILRQVGGELPEPMENFPLRDIYKVKYDHPIIQEVLYYYFESTYSVRDKSSGCSCVLSVGRLDFFHSSPS